TEGRNPAPQLEDPPLVPLPPVLNTTKEGRSEDSLPKPYVAQAPTLGRPNICAPVFMKICAGAWLNASVTIDFTTAMSSATVARCGRSSDNSVPLWPWRENLN